MTLGEFRQLTKDLPDNTEVDMVVDEEETPVCKISINIESFYGSETKNHWIVLESA